MAVELSQGYVSFSVSTEGAQKQLQTFFNGWQGLADSAGKQVGAGLNKGLMSGTTAALADAKAAHERYAIDAAGSLKKAEAAATAQEAALRKVAIAEARLTELQNSGKATQSQILTATDRLATARKSSSDAALKQAAADKSVKDAQDALRLSADKLTTAQKGVDDSASKAGNSASTMASKIKSGLSTLAAKMTNPFKPLEKDASDSGDQAGKNFSKEFKDKTSKLGDGLKAGIAGFMGGLATGAVSGLANELKSFYTEARESQKVGATTEQIIKSTGGTAKISAEEVGKLAQSISNKTGIDDEQIQAGANLLLTFKNVRNEVGQGSDIFNRATMAAQDMAAAGFGDAESASKMLGKALNDPIAGLSALGRAGVTFSAEQKEQIKGMVAQGDLLGAQKLMMKEVESQVGGVAAASATAGEKFTTQLNNLKENIGTAFMPMFDKVMGKAGEFVQWFGPAFQGVFDLFSKGDFTADFASAFGVEEDSPVVGFLFSIRDGFTEVVDKVKLFVGAFTGAGAEVGNAPWMNDVIDFGAQARSAFDTLRGHVVTLAESFKTNLLPGLLTIARAVQDNVVPFVKHLADLFVTNVMPVIDKFVAFITTQVLPILGMLATFIGEQVVPVVTRIATIIVDTVVPAFTKIYNVILEKVLPPLMTFVRFIMENVMPKVMLVFNEVIVPAFKLLASIVTWAVDNIVVPLLGKVGDFIKNVVGPVFKWLWENAISPAIDSIVKGIQWVRDDGVKTFTDFMDKVKAVVQTGVDTVGRVWAGIQDAFRGPMTLVQDIINGLIDAFNTVSKIFGGPTVAHVQLVTTASNIPPSSARTAAMATGGIVLPGYSPGVDNMHFYSPQWGSLSLSGGEAIMVPEFARMLGARGVEMLNQAARAGRQTLSGVLGGMHFAGGGLVNFRGGTFTTEFARRLQLAEVIAQAIFTIAQGGFRPATSYSGTSHQGDAVDISNPINTAVLIALRSLMIPAWDRTGMGDWMPHIHGVPLPGAGEAAGSAVWQAQDYLAGGDGLGGRDTGPRVGFLDSLSGIVLNLASGAASLINWPATFAAQLAKAAGIEAPGLFGDVLRAMPATIATTIGAGANKLLGLPGFSSGTSSAPAGWGWVGESGPELIRFRGGEQILSSGDSMRLGPGGSSASDLAAVMDGAAIQITGANLLADTLAARFVLAASRRVGH